MTHLGTGTQPQLRHQVKQVRLFAGNRGSSGTGIGALESSQEHRSAPIRNLMAGVRQSSCHVVPRGLLCGRRRGMIQFGSRSLWEKPRGHLSDQLFWIPPSGVNVRRFMRAPGGATWVTARLDWGYLIVLAFSLPVLWPLLGPSYLQSHDGLHHLYRLVDLDFCIRGGTLYPRWLPNLGFGYGYPVLNYYAPLSYYVAELFHILGAGYIDSIKLTYALGFLGSGLAMYLFAKESMGRIPALLASLVYVYLPYHLADAYVRGALAEFLSFLFFPLILWCFYKLITAKKTGYIAWSALSLAGLILTHNLMALIFAPLLVAYVVFLWFRERDLRALSYAVLALVLALALAAFYWLPGFAEAKWARLGQVGPRATDYTTRLITMSDFFSPSFFYRYFPEQGVSLEHPISWLQFSLVCLSIAVPLRLRHPSWNPARKRLLFFQGATFVSLLMLFTYSRFLWDHVPLLPYLQYPFRFLTLATFTSAFAIGALPLLLIDGNEQKAETSWPPRGRSLRSPLSAGVIVALLMITALPGLPIEPMYLPEHEEPLTEETVDFATMAEYDYLTGLWTRLWGGPWLLEYLPAWVEEDRGQIFLPLEKPHLSPQNLQAEDVASISLGYQGPLSRELTVRTTQPLKLSLHSFYFPNWRTYVDGHNERVYPSGSMGLLTLDVPAGQHQVLVRFEETAAERAGTIILLMSLCMFLAILLLARQWKPLLACLLSVLLLFSLRTWHVRSSPSVQDPVPLEANLGDEVKLLGYHLDEPSYHPGDTINVTLYWLALQEMEENYKVFVHLTDQEETRLIAQSDRWPVYNFSPTTRWRPGEMVWDRHEIQIPADEVPGSYGLATGMYILETMENLNVLDESGNPQGTRISLAAIDVAP